MADAPFFRGKDATLRLFNGPNEVIINAKTWSCKAVKTKGKDDVNGEDRARPYSVLDLYEFTFSGYNRDTSTFDAWLAEQAEADGEVAPLSKACGIKISPINGTTSKYQATELVFDELEINQGGRTDAVMSNSGFRCRYFKAVP